MMAIRMIMMMMMIGMVAVVWVAAVVVTQRGFRNVGFKALHLTLTCKGWGGFFSFITLGFSYY